MGYISVRPIIEGPMKEPFGPAYSINVNKQLYCVVLSNCCTISGNEILLAPLIKVKRDFFSNPYLAGDLTRINRKMTPQQSMTPQQWESLTYPEQLDRQKEGMALALLDFYIYEPNGLLEKYKMKIENVEQEIGYYMVNFKQTCGISCKKMFNPRKEPNPDALDFYSKILELSIEGRNELRDKLSQYFGKIPNEDALPIM